ncbi:hypothetical protein V6Z12_A04G121200 [Gossypium hirsutum]
MSCRFLFSKTFSISFFIQAIHAAVSSLLRMGKGNKEGTSKQFRWTKLMEYLFFEILAEEAQKGNKPSNSFY